MNYRHTDDAPAAIGPYSQAVELDGWLYTSGQVGLDPATGKPLGFGTLYRMVSGEGSGVIFSDDGYILTNHHVIDQASNIRVVLWDGRIIPARVIGSDPATVSPSPTTIPSLLSTARSCPTR